MTQTKGPNTHLNRACHRIRQACEAIHQYRSEFPKEVREERNSMFCEDFKTLAAYEAADVVAHLLQYSRRQLGQIKAMANLEKKPKSE